MKSNDVQVITAGAVGVISAVSGWLFSKFGVLYYITLILVVVMAFDYFTGMAAGRREAMDHPNDPAYGWNSAKGAAGIIKKFGYLCIILVGVVVDYIILYAAAEVGIQTNIKALFGLMVAVWCLLNELLSIIENAGRMGAQVPTWLAKYISVLKNKIEDDGGQNNG